MADERVQHVIFMRHGVAKHNLRGPGGEHPNLHDPALTDPSLVPAGEVAALQAGCQVSQWLHSQRLQADLIITSPLTRCIQTATLAFLRGQDYTKHVPFQCVENVREAFGMHTPDRRRQRSVLEKHWPQVQFPPDMTEEDEAWRPDYRETWEDIGHRVANFLTWLVQRPENCILTVSHGVWMETFLRTYDPTCLGQNGRVYNCDAYCCQIVSRNGAFLKIQRTMHIAGQQR